MRYSAVQDVVKRFSYSTTETWSVVIMNNATFHKSEESQRLIEMLVAEFYFFPLIRQI